MDNWFLDDQTTTEDVLKMVLNIAAYTDQQNPEEVQVSFALIAEAMERLLREAMPDIEAETTHIQEMEEELQHTPDPR